MEVDLSQPIARNRQLEKNVTEYLYLHISDRDFCSGQVRFPTHSTLTKSQRATKVREDLNKKISSRNPQAGLQDQRTGH